MMGQTISDYFYSVVGVIRTIRNSTILIKNSIYGVRMVLISTETTINGIITIIMIIMVSPFVVFKTGMG
jgi:hypothetical protein